MIRTSIHRVLGIAIAVMLLIVAGCSTTPRGNTLKVYNWGDYIDEELLDEFETWYKEQTGESVEVIYQTFDINEVMLAKIDKGKADFDVVCPSEYIIERMLRNDMLIPIIDTLFEQELDAKGINYLNCISPYIKQQFSLLEAPEGIDPNKYAVGYMWGTTGILYNTKYVSEEEALSWELMFDERLRNKIFIKDAFRDVYSPMLIYAKTLEARKRGDIGPNDRLSIEEIHELMFDSSDEAIAIVESNLKRMKELVAGWEADFGKEMMTQEKAWINLMWSGDAVWAIEEAAKVDVELDYVVPEEGSIVWFDGWVIPKYAKNVRAARYFIDFMCMPENAIRNMETTGYVSVIATKEVMEEMSDEECEECDLGYFFCDSDGNAIEGSERLPIDDVMYPDREIIERCGVMHDSGDRTEKMLEMWSRVKGDNLTPGMVIFITLFFTTFIAIAIIRKVTRMRRNRRMMKRRHKQCEQQQK